MKDGQFVGCSMSVVCLLPHHSPTHVFSVRICVQPVVNSMTVSNEISGYGSTRKARFNLEPHAQMMVDAALIVDHMHLHLAQPRLEARDDLLNHPAKSIRVAEPSRVESEAKSGMP